MGFEKLGKKLMQLGQDTKSGVQKMSESYQINAKITEEKKVLSHLYEVIGQKLYEQNTESPLEGLEEEFAAIKASLENIQVYNDQLQQVKGVAVCPACGKEAAKGEKFCSGCGTKLPEITDEIKADIKDAAGEAAGAAGEIVNDAIDKAKAFARGFTSRGSSKETVVDVEATVVSEDGTEETSDEKKSQSVKAEKEMSEAAEEEAGTFAESEPAEKETSEAAEEEAGTFAESEQAEEETSEAAEAFDRQDTSAKEQ